MLLLPKIKSLIYPLLIYDPAFTLFSNNNKLEKSFLISREFNNCKVNGTVNFYSRYLDKISIGNSCNKDIVQCFLKIYYGEDTYYETINYDLIYLTNNNKPYQNILKYNLLKNNLPIKISEVDEDLLNELNIYKFF
jgi:hypothetical protein